MLLRKPRAYAEVYNDLDGEVVNCFRVLQDPAHACRLQELLTLTPFARAEFDLSYSPSADPIEAARRLLIRSFMGFGSTVTRPNSGNSNRSGTTPAQDWRNYAEAVPDFTERLRGVVIENRDAAEVMRQHDSSETLHYVDPPYPHETRGADAGGSHRGYRFEMTTEDHERLAGYVRDLAGLVVLSTYRCELYDRLFSDWVVHEIDTHADGARERREAVYLNPACAKAQRQTRLIA